MTIGPSGRAAALATRTATTTYTYNADGAPVAVTVDGATTYFTYDNFIPHAGAPTDGTVNPGNGNLRGLGPAPGGDARFAYDARNRLTACHPPGRPAVSYVYHAASLMKSSTLDSGDRLDFYYDNTATPLMSNTRQPSTGQAASFLGPVRYLSDGSEQILFTPRKDVAGRYDAAAQTLTPYHYDPYGASTDPVTPARQHVSTSALGPSPYDLSDNPFQYAGEYRDPTCDAYYLRARWYLAEHQTFLSRDAADGMHRYGYTGGNPVGRTDPSGFKFTGADFSRDVDKAVHALTPGAWAYVEPVLPVWGQALGGVQLAGLLPSFFHHPSAQGYATFGFLAASMVAEAGLELPQADRSALFLLHPGAAFGTRLGVDAALGGAQTFAQSDRHGRLDVPALLQGIETTTAGIVWSRIVGGVGYRPFNMTSADVDAHVNGFYNRNPRSDDVFVFRCRQDLTGLTADAGWVTGHFAHRPILEWSNIGLYHESVVALGRGTFARNEIVPEAMAAMVRGEHRDLSYRTVRISQYLHSPDTPYVGTAMATPADAYRYVGRVGAGQVDAFTQANPSNYQAYDPDRSRGTVPRPKQQGAYDQTYNNAHHHVAGVLRQLGL